MADQIMTVSKVWLTNYLVLLLIASPRNRHRARKNPRHLCRGFSFIRLTAQIEAIFCAATWTETNGFDSYTFFQTYPEKPSISVVEQLQKAFGTRFEEAMTQLVLGTVPSSAVFADPLTPVTFSVDGIDYAWQPSGVPLKLNDGPR